jgi:ketosteroid isomerase-like protein
MQDANREVVERYWRALDDNDMSALGEVYAEDAIQEWPQSGERVVGRANIVAINENYPGLPKASVRRILASGDLCISEVSLDYGGEKYEAVSVLELRDGKIAKETDYFAACFEAPRWRDQWVEKM